MCAILGVVLRHGTLRPWDPTTSSPICEVAGLDVDAALPGQLAPGRGDPLAGTVGDPSDPDRDAARPKVTGSVSNEPLTAVDPTRAPDDE
jgi:hypothetical protein